MSIRLSCASSHASCSLRSSSSSSRIRIESGTSKAIGSWIVVSLAAAGWARRGGSRTTIAISSSSSGAPVASAMRLRICLRCSCLRLRSASRPSGIRSVAPVYAACSSSPLPRSSSSRWSPDSGCGPWYASYAATASPPRVASARDGRVSSGTKSSSSLWRAESS